MTRFPQKGDKNRAVISVFLSASATWAVVPEHELWLYKNEKALDAVTIGREEAKSGKLEKNAIDVDQFD